MGCKKISVDYGLQEKNTFILEILLKMENEAIIFRELHAGTILADGKYVIENVLGVGGFGITYKARHAKLNQFFAIKEFFINGFCMRHTQHFTVHLQGMQEDMYIQYRKKFVEEAQTLAKLDHPNIVRIIDIFDENGTSYIVMPFIQGETIQNLVEKNGVLPYEVGVNYIAQVCEAVDYIHKHDILHRDIKPENIIITPENKAILIDFGSAREFVHDKTQSHTTILTQGYAPPEQYSTTSRKGSYSDIYSIGAVFYFILTGKKPMDATSRLLEDLDAPQKYAPNLSDEANRTILKAMSIKPENRYQNVDELMYELTGHKDWKSTSNPEVIIKKGISKKIIIGLVIAAILLFAGGGTWFYLHDKAVKEQNIVDEAKRNMLDGKVEGLNIWLYEGAIYLRPTKGVLDQNVYYEVGNNAQLTSISTLPSNQHLIGEYIYTGQMQNGFPNGEGFAIYDNKATYTGTFNKGLKYGTHAKYVEPDGTTFEGNYVNDMRSGKGKLFKKDGTIFEGIWRDGKIDGEGRIFDATGKIIESGVYKE